MVVLVLLFYLVILPAIAGATLYLMQPAGDGRHTAGGLHVGDAIVYCKQKASKRPGPRAKEVYPAPFGETYSYLVEKFWTVEGLLDDGRIVATTRTHKRHVLNPDDPNLHKAGWIVRVRNWSRFPKVD